MLPRPVYSAADSVARLLSMCGVPMPYVLGTGDFRPDRAVDEPWTARVILVDGVGTEVRGCDCAGAGLWARGVRRHRPGFNRGPHREVAGCDVEDDINTNSAIGDALDAQDLFRVVPHGEPIEPGDVLAYPTIRLSDGITGKVLRHPNGAPMEWIGHWQTAIETFGVRVGESFTPIKVVQCFGGNMRKPAFLVTDAHAMDAHDHQWPMSDHRTRVLRFVP